MNPLTWRVTEGGYREIYDRRTGKIVDRIHRTAVTETMPERVKRMAEWAVPVEPEAVSEITARAPEATVIRGCTGKTGFLTASSAYRAVKQLVRRRKFKPYPNERVEPYHCTAGCGLWHIGSALK